MPANKPDDDPWYKNVYILVGGAITAVVIGYYVKMSMKARSSDNAKLGAMEHQIRMMSPAETTTIISE